MMRCTRRRNRARRTHPLDAGVFGSGHLESKQIGWQDGLSEANLHRGQFLDCRPGPPRLTHSLTLLSMISTWELDGILQWLFASGGIAIRQSGPFNSARTAARH